MPGNNTYSKDIFDCMKINSNFSRSLLKLKKSFLKDFYLFILEAERENIGMNSGGGKERISSRFSTEYGLCLEVQS